MVQVDGCLAYSLSPGAQLLIGVVPLLDRAEAVKAKVGEGSGGGHGALGAGHVVNAEAGAVASKQVQALGLEPGTVTKLKGVANVCWKEGEEGL